MYEEYLKYVKDYLTVHNGDAPPNPLMEADLLDEEGTLRLVWYTLDKGISGAQSYEDVYQHIVMGNNKRLINPMVTEKAKHYWNEKQKFVEAFTKQLEDDITVNM